jgi:hypothetical protein
LLLALPLPTFLVNGMEKFSPTDAFLMEVVIVILEAQNVMVVRQRNVLPSAIVS